MQLVTWILIGMALGGVVDFSAYVFRWFGMVVGLPLGR